MSFNNIGIYATIGALVLILPFIFRRRVPKGLRLPPGPPGHFLIGNLRDIPSEREWETHSEWHKKYGDLVYVNVLGTSLLYVNSAEMARELFDKRSAIYSDRPRFPMLELIGWNWVLGFMPYGERWRRYRQVFNQTFSPSKQMQYTPIQVKHSKKLLKKLLKSSDQWKSSLRHLTGATSMEIAYGIDVLPENDPYIARSDFAVDLAVVSAGQGAYLVNMIPQLRYLPEWFPGAGFLRQAKVWKEKVKEMYTIPFQFVKKELAAGTAKQSLTSALLEEAYVASKDQKISEDREELISHLAGAVFAGGADTIASTLEIFILAMILHPQAQSKAQEELDAIIGPHRLPSIEDRSNLPYVRALCKEVLRWHPLNPSVFPHRLIQDDIVGQYFIPAGTLVSGSAWAMLHSEATYGADPMSFKPERFLDSPEMPDPYAVFGFGRRVCPGRTLSENALFIAAASILHVFNIVPPPGGTPPDPNAFLPGIFARPMPFECDFVPRSEAAKTLINQID